LRPPFSSGRRRPIGRFCDAACAAAGLLLLSPLMALVAFAILLRDGRPILYNQIRIGRYGVPFRIWKFRTMRAGAAGSAVTAAGDHRITAIGARLRKFKLDELPQLFNVLRGDMSLVGPRPEAPEYVNAGAPMWRAVLQVRPGITDLATLIYRDEEALLEASGDAERFYREGVLPAKLWLNLAYMRTRSFWKDLTLIWLSICYSLSPDRFDAGRVRKAFGTGAEYGGNIHSLSSAVDR
jgi:lipopolysaccharide/colanic/teichoic acid biosynthesis glycosyltransferase